jgi:hypothetical protein
MCSDPNLRINFSLGLDDPDVSPDSALSHIVRSHLKARDRGQSFEAVDLDQLWDAEFFGLHRVRLYQQASVDQQRQILAGCARSLLNEAYFIEKSGTAYCAKMILMAETTEVRQVYGLIAADEATHLEWVRPFVVAADRGAAQGPLLRFLSDLIQECDMNTLAFLVQIILEGWGLSHYQNLSRNCKQPVLRDILHAIHRDEALHHHTGEVIFDPARVTTSAQQSLIEDSLHGYTTMIRVGPQNVVRVIDEVFGGLTKAAIIDVFAQLETETQSHAKLQLLRDLMLGPGREKYVARLDESGAFSPHSPQTCAATFG